MSEFDSYLPFVLFSVPFIVAALFLIKSRVDARRAEAASDYERFIWPDASEEPEEDELPVRRRYISYSA